MTESTSGFLCPHTKVFIQLSLLRSYPCIISKIAGPQLQLPEDVVAASLDLEAEETPVSGREHDWVGHGLAHQVRLRRIALGRSVKRGYRRRAAWLLGQSVQPPADISIYRRRDAGRKREGRLPLRNIGHSVAERQRNERRARAVSRRTRNRLFAVPRTCRCLWRPFPFMTTIP